MKVAFTSCFDVLDDPSQTVWLRVADERPDVLLLLGDSIYMDFGPPFPGFSHPLGKPQGWSPERFAKEMYQRYRAQSEVQSFRQLVGSLSNAHVGAIWDDHDFGWNGAFGSGSGPEVLPAEKKLIARGLHMQFRAWLRTRPLPANYPAQPSMESFHAGPDVGIEEVLDIDSVRFLMVDGRYYREKPIEYTDPYTGLPVHEPGTSSVLGPSQREWLSEKINEWPGIRIICSGSTLTGRSDAWEQYHELAWLKEQDFQRTIILSGDIHTIASRRHKSLHDLWELTASGAARPGLGGDSGNFGILDISGSAIEVQLFDEDGLDKTKRIEL
jgi:alkaline phosphatase D